MHIWHSTINSSTTPHFILPSELLIVATSSTILTSTTPLGPIRPRRTPQTPNTRPPTHKTVTPTRSNPGVSSAHLHTTHLPAQSRELPLYHSYHSSDLPIPQHCVLTTKSPTCVVFRAKPRSSAGSLVPLRWLWACRAGGSRNEFRAPRGFAASGGPGSPWCGVGNVGALWKWFAGLLASGSALDAGSVSVSVAGSMRGLGDFYMRRFWGVVIGNGREG